MPALCTMLAQRSGAFGQPFDACVAGINPGFNTGGLIMHSGTVGAALTAANTGIPAVAVSIGAVQTDPTRVPGDQVGEVHSGGTYHWETAARLAADALAWLMEQPRPERFGPVLNLNVPNVLPADLLGVRDAPLARFPAAIGFGPPLEPDATSMRFGLGRSGSSAAARRGTGTQGRPEPKIPRPPSEARAAATDTALVAQGWVTATSLQPVREGNHLDVANALAAGLAALYPQRAVHSPRG
jgi:5'-nucleotidase